MENVKILICAHKKAILPNHDFFLPIQAGAALSAEKLPYVQDDTGDNISEKNRNYCELTCHYWAWKNLKNVSIIGLNHYRRYFDFDKKFCRFAPDRTYTSLDLFLNRVYHIPDFTSLFKHFDILLPTPRYYPYSMDTQYCTYHVWEDWFILYNIIKTVSPEYIPAYQHVILNRNYSSNYNMFITKWEHFNEYSDWLFKILFEAEKQCKLSPYPAQARLFGYFAERLINVYCEYKHLRIKYVPVTVIIDDYSPSINQSYLHYNLAKWRDCLAYKISRL